MLHLRVSAAFALSMLLATPQVECLSPMKGGAAGATHRGPKESVGQWTSTFKIEMDN